MSKLSLITINILNDLSRWRQRRGLLVEQLSECQPDLIALQEVTIQGKSSNAHWLVEQLNKREDTADKPYQVYLCPKTGAFEKKEGLAVLSRLPVNHHERLDLLTQNRVAQAVTFRLEGETLMLVNGHFFWHAGPSPKRLAQVELLLDWLDTQPAEIPVIVCGDFNSEPDTPAVKFMRRYFDSAHLAVHGEEPEYTCPTPLPLSVKTKLRIGAQVLMGQRPSPDQEWRGTLDYIFVDPRLDTQACDLVLNCSSKHRSDIYPSDHFGLYAQINVS
ncbi:MAG: endonuclease/exonuclease/phosphatase family protein [Chloroflexota bacterium]